MKQTQIGLKHNARSPGSIANAQHHDPSGAERDMGGSAATFKTEDIHNTTDTVPVHDRAVLRVFNTTGAVEYLWVGLASEAPVTVDATNGIALVPEFYENLYCGVALPFDDSIAFKASSGAVQVTVMQR